MQAHRMSDYAGIKTIMVMNSGFFSGSTYMRLRQSRHRLAQWWLKGDQEAAKIFTGPEPGVGKMEKLDLFEEEYRIKREKPGSMPGFIC